jgi:tight adherence protein C
MLLLLGAGLLFTALVVALSTMGVLTSERRAVARSVAAVQAINSAPSLISEELERPFAERVIAPLGGRLVGIGRKITRADTAEKIAHRLDIAGNPPAWDVNRIIGLKVLGLGAIGGLGFLFCLSQGYSLNRIAIFTAGFAALGYMLPNLLLKNAGDKRESLMRNALPDAIDLLTISVEAGLGFDAAVARSRRCSSASADPRPCVPWASVRAFPT